MRKHPQNCENRSNFEVFSRGLFIRMNEELYNTTLKWTRKDPEKFESVSHFVRIAVIKLIKSLENKQNSAEIAEFLAKNGQKTQKMSNFSEPNHKKIVNSDTKKR